MGREDERKHRELIGMLEERVKSNYTVMLKEEVVRDVDTGRVIGEIDLAGILGSTWDIFEVKVNDGRAKACKQLRNLRRYMCDCGDIRLFYYSGKKDSIEEIE